MGSGGRASFSGTKSRCTPAQRVVQGSRCQGYVPCGNVLTVGIDSPWSVGRGRFGDWFRGSVWVKRLYHDGVTSGTYWYKMSNEMTKDPGMVERIVNFYLAFDLTFYLAVFWHSFWHFIWQFSGILPGILCYMAYLLLQALVAARWSQRSRGRFDTDLVMLGSRFWVCADVKFGPLLTYFFLSWGISRYILSVPAIRWQSPGLVLGKHRSQAIYLARVCGWSGRGISDKCGFGPGGRLPVPAPTCAASGDLHKLDITLAPGRTGVMDWFGKLYLDEGERIYI